MAEYVSKVVDDYEISDQLGFFTLDNAPLNDTCLIIFFRAFFPTITNDEIQIRRIRCFGHVINLAAKVFLFGNNPDAFEAEDVVLRALERYIEKSIAWRKHGPVRKLHNLGTWIRKSP
jgi:hypothetical protein